MNTYGKTTLSLRLNNWFNNLFKPAKYVEVKKQIPLETYDLDEEEQ